MARARILTQGKRQAVLLPKDFWFSGKEVEILWRDGEVVLRDLSKGMARAFWLIANLAIDWKAVEEMRKRDRPRRRKRR
jgi:virulence-associated protein VagC